MIVERAFAFLLLVLCTVYWFQGVVYFVNDRVGELKNDNDEWGAERRGEDERF